MSENPTQTITTDTVPPTEATDNAAITVTGADDTGKAVTGELIPQSRLLFFENAKSALAQATTINEVKSVRDKAIGLVAYAKKATDRELEADAEAIRLEAERRLGQMMQAQKETDGLNKGGRPKTGFSKHPVSSPKPTFAEAGIDKNLADRARKLAAMTEKKFEEAVKAKRQATRKTNKPKAAPPAPKKKATPKPKRITALDVLDVWKDLPVEEHRRFFDGIGLNAILTGIPEAWLPALEEWVAKRRIIAAPALGPH
jgi:hypothetical protein